MRGIALVALLALAACAGGDGMSASGPSSELRGWRNAAGQPPSKAELAAVVAACQDRARGAAIDGCLADLGLRRVN